MPILLLMLFQSHAQDSLSKYSNEQLLEKAYNVGDAMLYCEEILNRNPDDCTQGVALIYIAQYYTKVNGDYPNAIKYAHKSLVFSKKKRCTESIIYATASLSIFYASVNNNQKALFYLHELKKYSHEKNYDEYSYEGNIYGMLGDYEKSTSIFKSELQKIEALLQQKNLAPQERSKLIDRKQNYYVDLATSYNYQKKLDSASFYIDKTVSYDYWFIKAFNLILRKDYDDALAHMEDRYEKQIKPFKPEVYQYLYYKAICFHQKGDYQKGLDYAEQALKNKTVIISFQNFELECYKIATDCAEKLGLTTKALEYSRKYAKISQMTNYAEKAAFMSKLYEQNEINPLQRDLNKKSDRAKILVYALIIASLIIGYFVFRTIKSRKQKKLFLDIIANLEKNKATVSETSERELSNATEQILIEESEEEETTPKKNISPETENKILKKLESFERKQQFLNPSISLGTLALDFKTNASYITYVIKTHKNENLTNYINKLRIDYIIQKMGTNPQYANYKVEYLAQESGFASYSTFKRIFNKKTGMDPSKFIGFLKNEANFQH